MSEPEPVPVVHERRLSRTLTWKEKNEKAKLKVLFNKYDIEKSKALTEEELFITLIKAFGIKPQLINMDKCKEVIKEYMIRFDDNHDGVTEFNEFYEIYLALKHDGFDQHINDEEVEKKKDKKKRKRNKDSPYLEKLLPRNRQYKLILSCDGGGVRGLMSSTFLVHLEKALGCRCHDIFDMMAGVSTGSIITGGLCALNRTAEEVRCFYDLEHISHCMPKSLLDKVMGIVQKHSKYDGQGKSEKLNEFFGETKMGECSPILVIHAYNITKRKVEFFTSNKTPDVLVRDVIDTSSSAPIFYPPIKLGDDWYIDGGVIANDPSMVALSEGMSLWGDDVPIRILSVGTGVSSTPIDGQKAKEHEWGPMQWFAEGDFINVCLDSTISSIQAENILGQNYFRVNGNLGDYNVESDLDCLTFSNYTNLIHMGDKLWELYGQQTIDFLTS